MSIGVYVFIYFSIGALFCLAIDMANTYFNNRGYIREEEVDLSNLERIVLTIVWPFGMFIFFRTLIKNLRK